MNKFYGYLDDFEMYDDILIECIKEAYELLFESNDMNTGWDGKFNGILLPKGIYVYYVYFTDNSKTEHYRSGRISLL